MAVGALVFGLGLAPFRLVYLPLAHDHAVNIAAKAMRGNGFEGASDVKLKDNHAAEATLYAGSCTLKDVQVSFNVRPDGSRVDEYTAAWNNLIVGATQIDNMPGTFSARNAPGLKADIANAQLGLTCADSFSNPGT